MKWAHDPRWGRESKRCHLDVSSFRRQREALENKSHHVVTPTLRQVGWLTFYNTLPVSLLSQNREGEIASKVRWSFGNSPKKRISVQYSQAAMSVLVDFFKSRQSKKHPLQFTPCTTCIHVILMLSLLLLSIVSQDFHWSRFLGKISKMNYISTCCWGITEIVIIPKF